MNRHYWREDWPDSREFFFGEMFPEPHSTKQLEDCVGWAMQTTPETMILGYSPPYPGNEAQTVAAAPRRCVPGARDHRLTGHVPEPGRAVRGSQRSPAATTSSSRAAATSRRRATRSR